MVDEQWQIVPREADLSRIYDPLSKWSRLHLVERHNVPDTWTVTGDSSTMSVFTPGSGSILDKGGEQVTSGKAVNIRRGVKRESNGRVSDITTVTFSEDLARLQRAIYPVPTSELPSGTVSGFSSAYDLRSGAIETLILGYIRSHAGDLAVTSRQIPRLRFPVDLARGGTTQVSGRLDHLGVLVRDLAEAGDLAVTIKHTEDGGGTWLDLFIEPVRDLSDDVRFGTADATSAGIITDWSYERGAPRVTRAIVAGSGELVGRLFLQLNDPAAEIAWGDVVESVIDQRQIASDSPDMEAEMLRAAQEALDEGGEQIKVEFEPVLGPDLKYRRDVRMGDIVGYDLPGLAPAKEKIREATTVVTVQDGQPTETTTVMVGTLDAMMSRAEQQMAKALRTIDVIKRSQ